VRSSTAAVVGGVPTSSKVRAGAVHLLLRKRCGAVLGRQAES
jgi:hypothetical protein